MEIAAERSYPTPYANSAILPLLLLSLASQRRAPKSAKNIHTEYDYIIVGGGTSGSVVANRLSELPCVNVLLLEAGKDPPLLTDVPSLSRFFRFTDIDWNYKTVPQKHTGEAILKGEIPLSLGKVLGGSSTLNSVIATRGSRYDYDGWAEKGAVGWSYEEVLPYFKKMEDNKDPEYIKNGFHNKGGFQTIQRPKYQPEIKRPAFQAARAIGFKVVDPNAWRMTGFYDFQAPIRGGQRCSTAKAYLVPAENRTNLDVLPNARVRKVIIQDGEATGVLYDYEGETYEVHSRREVIMAAGAVNTAQLLMLSGVGPKNELEKFKIPVFADLPVGENLQDHCAVPINFALNSSVPGVLQKLVNPMNVELYIKTKSGPLSSPDFITAVGFVDTEEGGSRNSSSSYQIRISEETTLIPKLQYGLKPEIYSEVFTKYENKPYFSCLSQTLHPRSRGTVKLQSSDPYDPPLIDPNYMEHPKDVQDIVDGLKTCKKLAATPAMKKLRTTSMGDIFPGCEQYRRNEELNLWCIAKQLAISMNNPVGTAKMGNPLNPETVVDAELRVKYLTGLRVVDASIMPRITSGDTSIPKIMIAEKASDIIKLSIDCEDYVAESEVQASVPMLSISPEILGRLPKLLKKPTERRVDKDLTIEQIKAALGLSKSTIRTQNSNIYSQIKELSKAIQDSKLNRRQEQSSSTDMREVVRCLEEIRQKIQMKPTQMSPNVVYTSGDSSEATVAQLTSIINTMRQNTVQGNVQNVGNSNDVSSLLRQISSVVDRINGDRVSSETSSSSSITSNNGATTENVVNQILTTLNILRDQGQFQTGNSNTGTTEEPNALLNQLSSAIRGISPNLPSTENTLINQLSSTIRGISPNLPGSENEQNALINQLSSAIRGTSPNLPGSENEQNALLNQLSIAIRGISSNLPGSENEQNALLNQLSSMIRGMSPNVPGSQNEQNALLNQLPSAIRGISPNVQGGENEQTNLLNQLSSAIRGISQNVPSGETEQNTLLNQLSSAIQGISPNIPIGENAQNALLNQLLLAIREVSPNVPASAIEQNILLNQVFTAIRGISPNVPTTENSLSATGASQGNVQELMNQIISSINDIRQIEDLTRVAQTRNSSTDRTQDTMNQIFSAINGMRNTSIQSENDSTSMPNNSTDRAQDMMEQILSAINGMRNTSSQREDESTTNRNSTIDRIQDIMNQILSAINDMRNESNQRESEGTTTQNDNTDKTQDMMNQILSAVNEMRNTSSQVVNRGTRTRNSNTDSTQDMMNQILSAVNEMRNSSSQDQNGVTTTRNVNTDSSQDMMNQILSAVNEIRNSSNRGVNGVTTTRNVNTDSSQEMMNQILSAVNGIRNTSIQSENDSTSSQNNSTDRAENMMNQILSAINEMRNSSSRGDNGVTTTQNVNTDSPQDMMNQILSAINEMRNLSSRGDNGVTTTQNVNTDSPQDMMNQILSAVNEMRNSSSRGDNGDTTTPATVANSQEILLNQIVSTLNEIRQNYRLSEPANVTSSPNTNIEDANNSVLKEIFSAIKEVKENVRTANNNTTSNGGNSVQNNQGLNLQDPNNLLQQLLNQQINGNNQGAPPSVQTVVLQEGPGGLQITRQNPLLLGGMQPGVPMIPPGMPVNPMLNALQRQRQLQMLQALNGGNMAGLNTPILPPQMMGLPPPFQRPLPLPPPMMNRFPGVLPNQIPCQKTVILNNINLCNPNNVPSRPMTPNEMELCQSLQSATQCQNKSNCRTIQPYLYNHYCGRK